MSIHYEDRSISELAQTYNAFANELGLKLVKKFRTKAEGINRVKKIGDMHTERFSQFNQPNGATNGADMTNITETIRAAQEETDLPDDPVEAKATLEQQFSGEGDTEFRSLEGQTDTYVSNEPWEGEIEPDLEPPVEIQGEPEVEPEATAPEVEIASEVEPEVAEAHQEFGDPELPAPTSERKVKKSKTKKTTAAKKSTSKSDGSAEVDLSDPEAIVASFKIKPGTKKENMIRILAGRLDESVEINDLLTTVYGKKEVSESSFAGVKLGIQIAIDKNNLPFKLETSKRDGVKYIGLYGTK